MISPIFKMGRPRPRKRYMAERDWNRDLLPPTCILASFHSTEGLGKTFSLTCSE